MSGKLESVWLLANWPRPAILVFCAALILGIGVSDWLLGPEPATSIFYLPPIALATWHMSKWSGIFIALLSALVRVTADLWSGVVYSSAFVWLWNTAVLLGFFLIMLHLVHMMKGRLNETEAFAMTDALTHSANSRGLHVLAEKELAKARRHKSPITLAYLDLDNFKQVNDLFGHSEGDRVLQLVAQAMNENVRSSDTVARLGGDEFAILLPETDEPTARRILTRLHASFDTIMLEHNYPVGLSIGIATFPTPPNSVRAMIQKADRLMYGAKRDKKKVMR